MTQFFAGQLFFNTAYGLRSHQQVGKPEPPAKRKNRDTKPHRRRKKRGRRKR